MGPIFSLAITRVGGVQAPTEFASSYWQVVAKLVQLYSQLHHFPDHIGSSVLNRIPSSSLVPLKDVLITDDDTENI
jgi:hypothetical protein